MVLVTALRWDEARDCVRRIVAASLPLTSESVPLDLAFGRVLATDIQADRSYPPFPRSMRDGFAVRAADIPGRVRIVGEVRAGEPARQRVDTGEGVEIMTGAPVPEGADCVVMVEHVQRDADTMVTDRSLSVGDNISPRGCEASSGEVVLTAGTRLDHAHLAVLATVGQDVVRVYRQPAVSVIATGDELVEPNQKPEEHQIRNSNAVSLAAQARRAGARIAKVGHASDTEASLRDIIAQSADSDVLLFSGGVSAGKYDLVENVLAEYDAEFFFTRVLIQPGQPTVFGRARGKLFFGLPGNPVSTMVTFELFARLALELLEGERTPRLPLITAQLATPFRHKPGLTRFLPATLAEDGSSVSPVSWRGSGDVFSVARANAFLVAEHDRESWASGEFIRVLQR